jgi:hypothetical protein
MDANGPLPPRQTGLWEAIRKALRRRLWLVQVHKVKGSDIPCGYCGGSGGYDPFYQTGVPFGSETVRTIDCPECTGLGYHFIPEE